MVNTDDIRPSDGVWHFGRIRLNRSLWGRRHGNAALRGLVRQEGERNSKNVDVFRLKQSRFRVELIAGAPQTAPHHLLTQQLAGEGAESHDMRDSLGVPALRKHPHGNDALYLFTRLADTADRIHL